MFVYLLTVFQPKLAMHCLNLVTCAEQEGAYLLVGELTKALEEPSRRRGAADAIALFCRTAKFDFEEHLSSFITVRPARFLCMLRNLPC